MNQKNSFKKLRFLIAMLFIIIPSVVWSQSTVKGKVTDSNGDPLIGATITVKNSPEGTVSDVDGNYVLYSRKSLTSKDALVFAYLGIKIRKYPIRVTSLIW